MLFLPGVIRINHVEMVHVIDMVHDTLCADCTAGSLTQCSNFGMGSAI